MALYDTGRYRRAGLPLKSVRARPKNLGLIALTAGCGTLLAVSALEPMSVAPLRAAIAAPLTPAVAVMASGAAAMAGLFATVLDLLAAPFSPPSRLSLNDARRTALETRILDLERENRDLKALTRYSRAPKPQIVSARVVMSSASPLAQTVVIDAGRNQGVRGGHPVVAGDDLIGRVVQAYSDQSSVMLLTGTLSRVPVAVGPAQVHAVLTGTGTASARLEFIGPGPAIQPGDIVTTSGAGGVFPRGLGVGVVGSSDASSQSADSSAHLRVDLTAGRDNPLAIGVLLLDGGAFDALDASASKPKPSNAAHAREMDR